jgi:tetratricopeptide (TPR) repeat protein
MDTAHEVFEAAAKAEEAGDSESAIRLYEESSRIDRTNSLPLIRLGFLLCDKGKWEQAIRVGLQITKRWPKTHEAHFVIARSYGGLGRWTMAERYYRRVVTLQKTPATLVLLGHALINLERNDEAQEYFSEALKLDPNNDEVHLNLGYVYKVKGEIALAEKHLKRAIELDPEYALAYAQLGELLAKYQDRRKEAVDVLRSAVKHNPDDGWSRAYLAFSLWTLRRLKAAEDEYRKLLELWPNEGLAYWCYGDFLACEKNDSSTAEWYLRKGVEIEPEGQFTNYYLGKHLFHWNRDEEAKIFLTKAARLGHAKSREMLQVLTGD